MKRTKRTKPTKLSLSRETIRVLATASLADVRAGATGTIFACPKSKDSNCTIAFGADGLSCCE